ncbi:MAG: aldo/keto reductase [Myxococcota bacterium]
MTIPRAPFGATGHESSRVLFGAAALGSMRQEKADRLLETLLEAGVNHIDVAASYGDAELRVGPWMQDHRDDFFLATKTGERSGPAAREELERSLERLQVDRVDLIQLHNLVDEDGWQTAFGPGGAVEALSEARSEGLVRFVGVTGHGTQVAAMHRRSLERFPFDSVLLPCNVTMLAQPDYRADFDALLEICRERNVAVQTIKSIARRRWREDDPRPKFSWYEPLEDEAAIARAVGFVLSQPGTFLNSSSDARLLPKILKAAERFEGDLDEAAAAADVETFAMQPLFAPGEAESI